MEPPGPPGEVVHLRLPRPAELFARRARRFRELAPGNPMGEFLEALAAVADAQGAAVARVPPSPPAVVLSSAVPLRATAHARAPSWRDALATLVEALRGHPWPAPAAAALRRLAGAWPEELEALADGVVGGTPAATDLAAAPFVGAALQVYFAVHASGLPAEAIEHGQGACPVCESAPVAGVVLGDDRLRYLACSLCGSEWNLPRIRCWNCRSTGGIRYLGVAGDAGATKAEACSHCMAYLKLFYLDRMPAAEPLADDVASLTLDLLAAQEGWGRSGVNLFLLGGAEG
ncbi:MAG TPA: formate dehydrogenase accessory protein FdhE [Anaeromyxobacteraceae bacterium]|nr:formate dehydrogenase accessory protein FdhE [Anaeromyxobacteraceae bacterium]